MKTQKISFSNIKDVLNRAEMKNIMGGSGEPCGQYVSGCINGPQVTYWCNCYGSCIFIGATGGCIA